MIRDKILFALLIVFIIVLFAGFAFFGYKIIGEGKSFNDAISDLKGIVNTVQKNVDTDNNSGNKDSGYQYDISELKSYAKTKSTGDETKELFNKILENYLDIIKTGSKQETSITLTFSKNKIEDEKHIESVKSFLDNYVYVVLGKNPINETYNIYFETDADGNDVLKVIDNKDDLDYIGL